MNLIDKKNVTIESIHDLLRDSAIVSSDYDIGCIHAEQGGIDFGVFISIDDKNDLIRFATVHPCKEGTDTEGLLHFTNHLNDTFALVRFTPLDHGDGDVVLYGDYDFVYTFGLHAENFIATLRRFAKIYLAAVTRAQEEGLFE